MEFFSKIGFAFSHGGFWMWPILILQLCSFAVMAERAIFLFKKRKANQFTFAKGLEDNIRRGELDQVMSKTQAAATQEPIARAVLAGAQAAKNLGGKEEIQGKMDEVLLAENALLDKRTAFLSMFGNVATLVGLLGTISGMISSFAAVSGANPAERATLLASGISEAMNCTAYGLITAIPALVAYAILVNRANHLSEDLNQSALKVFNWLSYSYDPVTLRGAIYAGNANATNSAEMIREPYA